MTENDHDRTTRICKGNVPAAEFLCLWAHYCHAIDDVVDGDTKDAEGVISAFALAPLVYGHPFYLEHMSALRVVALLVANMYADSEDMKRGSEPWHRQFAEAYRHAGNEMVFAVALICGGYEHVREVSFDQRATCYETQHPPEPEIIAASEQERNAA